MGSNSAFQAHIQRLIFMLKEPPKKIFGGFHTQPHIYGYETEPGPLFLS